jgi:hypothetical protein
LEKPDLAVLAALVFVFLCLSVKITRQSQCFSSKNSDEIHAFWTKMVEIHAALQ